MSEHPIHIPDFNEENFSAFLPEELQMISKVHFTPFHIAEKAAEWLTEEGAREILDIGAGVGKFCMAAAAIYPNVNFTGIEFRPGLAKIANELIDTFGFKNAKILNQNIIDTDLGLYDAFYLYNPYYENIEHTKRINNEMPLSNALFRSYAKYTEMQLRKCPEGCRVVTYHGDNYEIPKSFTKIKTYKDELLKLWIKTS